MDEQPYTSTYLQQTTSQLSESAGSSDEDLYNNGCIPKGGYGSIDIPQHIMFEIPCDDECASGGKHFGIRIGVVSTLILLGIITIGVYLPAHGPFDAKLLAKQHMFEKKEEYQRPLYYNYQLVNHFAEGTSTWHNRYYVSSKNFKGPGSPILVVIGGEDGVDEILYPFVHNDLASQFGAYVLQTEHRFYGTSMPNKGGKRSLPTNDELKTLLSPDQALADAARLIRHIQGNLGCSLDRSSSEYCPVITIGASYPGFLSAMMRFVYPDVVDIGYASSAPIKMYGRQVNDPDVYFDHVTNVAEKASPGCAKAYKSTLNKVYDKVKQMPIDEAAKKLKICTDRIPSYITTSELFAEEITNLVGFANADFNMEYHPPDDPSTDLIRSCKAFQQSKKSPVERMADFFAIKQESAEPPDAKYTKCYDLHWDLPSGANATLTGSDFTGMGYGGTFRDTSDALIVLVLILFVISYKPISSFVIHS